MFVNWSAMPNSIAYSRHCGFVYSKTLDAHEADCRCDAQAVLAQLVERAETRRSRVDFDAVDDIFERSSREPEGGHVRCERTALRRTRLPAFVARREFVAPAREGSGSRCASIPLVPNWRRPSRRTSSVTPLQKSIRR